MRLRFAVTPFARARGLLWRKRRWLGDDGALVLAPCASVHTLGMREHIDIAFVGADGRVVRSDKRVKPGRVLSCHAAVAVIERFSPDIAAGDPFSPPPEPWFQAGDVVCLG